MRLSRMISSLRRPRRAAAETVGGVGEPVLVQPAGREDERRRRKARADERGQAEPRRERKDQRAREADGEARDRRRPGDAVDVERARRPPARRGARG